MISIEHTPRQPIALHVCGAMNQMQMQGMQGIVHVLYRALVHQSCADIMKIDKLARLFLSVFIWSWIDESTNHDCGPSEMELKSRTNGTVKEKQITPHV